MSSNKELSIVISAKEQFKKTFDQAESQIKSLGRVTKIISTNIASYMNASIIASNKLALTLGLTSTAGLLFAKDLMQPTMALEEQKVAFDTLLGSAEAGEKMLKDLSDFALRTPFQIPGIRETAKQLMAYGVEAEKIVPMSEMLGDLALGNQERFERLAYAYGQIKSAGRLYGTELRQVTETGIPIIKALAKHIGILEGEVRTAMENGQISFEDFDQAMQELRADKYMGLMEKGAMTLAGKLSNLKDVVRRYLEEAGKPFRESLKAVADKIRTFIEELPPLNVWLEQNKDTMTILAGVLFGALIPAIASITASLVSMIAVLTPWSILGVIIVKNWQALKDAFNKMLPILAMLATAFALIKARMITAAFLTSIRVAVFQLTGTFSIATGGIVAFSSAVKAATAASLAFIATPIGITITAIVASVGALTYAWQKQKKAQEEAAKSAEKLYQQQLEAQKEAELEYTKLANSAEFQFNRILKAQEEINYEDAIQELLKLRGVTEENLNDIVATMRDKAAESGDMGRYFALQFALGVSAEESVAALRYAGIAVSSKMLEGIRGTALVQAQLLGEEIVSKLASGISTGLPKVDKALNFFADRVGKKFGIVVGATSKLKDIFDEKFKAIETTSKKAADVIGNNVKKISEEIPDAFNKILNKADKLMSEYEKVKDSIESLASDHRSSVKSMLDDIADYEEKISQLSDPMSERNRDFAKSVAESIVDIEEDLKDAKEDLRIAESEDEKQEAESRINELQRILDKHQEYINNHIEDIDEARKIAGMDEIERMLYLHEKETQELKSRYDKEISLLQEKIKQEEAIFQAAKSKELLRLELIARAHLRQRAKIEGIERESLTKMEEELHKNLIKYGEIIGEQAENPELEIYIRKMEEIIAISQKAIEAAQKTSSITGVKFATGGIAVGGLTPFARGGIVNKATPALIGEGSMNEAIVPLPNGRSIPVEMRGGRGITINVNGGIFSDVDEFVEEVSQKLGNSLFSYA